MSTEPELRERLASLAGRVAVPSPPVDRLVRRGRVRLAMRVTVGVLSVGLAASAGAWGLFELGGIMQPGSRGPVGTSEADPAPGRVTRIEVGGRPIRRPVVAEGGYWSIVQLRGSGPVALVRIAPETNEPTIAPVSSPEFVTAGFGSIWVSSRNSVHRLDPETGQVVSTIPIGSRALFMAAGEGAVWVSSTQVSSVSLSRIDPETDRVTGSIELPGCCVGDLTAGEGAVWVQSSDQVLRIDPRSLRVTGDVRVGSHLTTAGVGGVWANTASMGPDEIKRIDPQTSRIVASMPGRGFGQPAVGLGYVWLGVQREPGNGQIEVYRIDPRSNRVLPRWVILEPAPARFGLLGHIGGPVVTVAVGEHSVWVGDEYGGQIVRVELLRPS